MINNILVGTWNIAANDDINLQEWIETMFEKSGNVVDLVVIGLEEVNNSSKIQNDLTSIMKDDHSFKLLESDVAMLWSVSVGFKIKLFIFHNETNDLDVKIKTKKIELTKHGSKYPITRVIGSKGAVAIQIANFLFVNCHLPFGKIKYNKRAINTIFNEIHDLIQDTEYMIFMGDLNSRSLIYLKPSADIKNISCSVSTKKKIQSYDLCHPKFYKLIKKIIKGDATEMESIILAKCNLSIIGYDGQESNVSKSDDIKQLMSTDILNNYVIPKTFLKKYKLKESKINFYPTYKRDPDTGCYTFYKGGYARLPGYPDRILYKNLNNIWYTDFRITGSDHFPIGALFSV